MLFSLFFLSVFCADRCVTPQGQSPLTDEGVSETPSSQGSQDLVTLGAVLESVPFGCVGELGKHSSLSLDTVRRLEVLAKEVVFLSEARMREWVEQTSSGALKKSPPCSVLP